MRARTQITPSVTPTAHMADCAHPRVQDAGRVEQSDSTAPIFVLGHSNITVRDLTSHMRARWSAPPVHITPGEILTTLERRPRDVRQRLTPRADLIPAIGVDVPRQDARVGAGGHHNAFVYADGEYRPAMTTRFDAKLRHRSAHAAAKVLKSRCSRSPRTLPRRTLRPRRDRVHALRWRRILLPARRCGRRFARVLRRKSPRR